MWYGDIGDRVWPELKEFSYRNQMPYPLENAAGKKLFITL